MEPSPTRNAELIANPIRGGLVRRHIQRVLLYSKCGHHLYIYKPGKVANRAGDHRNMENEFTCPRLRLRSWFCYMVAISDQKP